MRNIFNRYAKKYDEWYEKYYHAYMSELAAVRKALPKSGKGLEVGSGTGRFAEPLGIKYCLEPSKEMRKIAAKRGVKAVSGFAEKLPFKSAFFDHVLLVATICFVKDAEKTISEAKRVLKKNGRIIIGMVDANSLLGRFYRRKKSVFYGSADFFDVPQIAKMLKTAGFSRIKYLQTLFERPIKINQVEKPLKGYGRGGFVVISAQKAGK